MLVIITAAAHPSLRRRFHDHFEIFHRFGGWTALATFWTQSLFSARTTAHQWQATLGYVLLRSPNFWFICAGSCFTLLSWSRLRLRKVYPEKLSGHATRLHFRYRKMRPFYGIKLSDSPFTQWHAFATIPDADEQGNVIGFSIVVSNAGDWTSKQIAAAEERQLRVRGAPLHGVLYTSRLFKRIVLVATGSGIGPCLSLMFANVTPCRILWSTRDPWATYGPSVVAAVEKADPEAVIWNTSVRGYPDIVLETYQLVRLSDAEAVYVISNPKVTETVVIGMRMREVIAFGAIFDS